MAAAGWHTGAMQLTNSRAGRLLAGSLIVGVGLAGGAVAVMAIEDATSSDPEPGPTTTEVTVTDSTDAPASTVAVEPEPTGPTLAPGFEDYKPGDALPDAGAYLEGAPVTTVQGPYGPIYPDGYTNDQDELPTRTVPKDATEPTRPN